MWFVFDIRRRCDIAFGYFAFGNVYEAGGHCSTGYPAKAAGVFHAASFMRGTLASIVCLTAFFVPASPSLADPPPRSILVFVQSDPRGPFHNQMFGALRSVIDNEAREPVSLYLEYLDRSRFTAPSYQDEQRRYLEAKYRDRPIGVIVGFGGGTLPFALSLRASAFPNVPLVFGQVDETTYRSLPPERNVTGHIVRLELLDMVAIARAAVPGLKNIALVGDALDQQPVFRHFREYLPQVAKEFTLIDLTGLPMPELQQRVASLPEATAILYTAIYSDGRGTYYPPADALKLFASKANRPIVISIETNLGSGAIGGYLLAAEPMGTAAAQLALRVLEGEDPNSIPVTKLDAVRPVFDWQQLERWGIKSSALPANSDIRFRPDGKHAQKYMQLAAASFAIAVLVGVVTFAFYEHTKRRHAETATRQRISELAVMSRQATAGEMSAAIAHELNQPLGSILNNTETAELLLNSNAPNTIQLRELLQDIRHSDQRATEIIRQLRALMSKQTSNFIRLDLNEIAEEAIGIARIQANAKGVTLHAACSPGDIEVIGDTIQLQQVVINLVFNAIDAVSARPEVFRNIVVSTSLASNKFGEISVSDSGPGIPKENLDRIFEPFFTTKDNGMGVGLSLCRTIIEAHNGSIWGGNGLAGGAVFRFCLPVANGGTQHDK
jgi:signal transduction histidine kinase